MKFFRSEQIYIISVSPSHYPGFVFVKLEPGQDIISLGFIKRLQLVMSKLTLNVYCAMLKNKKDIEEVGMAIK